MILKKANAVEGAQSQIWLLAEERAGKPLAAAVDQFKGTSAETKAWLIANKIKYFPLNQMIYFFFREEDAVQFYLTWGV